MKIGKYLYVKDQMTFHTVRLFNNFSNPSQVAFFFVAYETKFVTRFDFFLFVCAHVPLDDAVRSSCRDVKIESSRTFDISVGWQTTKKDRKCEEVIIFCCALDILHSAIDFEAG